MYQDEVKIGRTLAIVRCNMGRRLDEDRHNWEPILEEYRISASTSASVSRNSRANR